MTAPAAAGWWNAPRVAGFFAVPVSRLAGLVRAGAIPPPTRIGRERRWYGPAVLAWSARQSGLKLDSDDPADDNSRDQEFRKRLRDALPPPPAKAPAIFH